MTANTTITAPITTKTTTVTTTTEIVTTITVVKSESKIIYIPFSCSFDGKQVYVAPTTSNVTKERGVWDVLVGKEDTTVIRIAEPTLTGVAATFKVRSNAGEPEWVGWTHTAAGFESPEFPDAAKVTIEVTATMSPAPSGDGGAAGVATGGTLAAGTETDKGTTLVVIIRKPGQGDRTLVEE